MRATTTPRGFRKVSFCDQYDQECSLQMSSACEPCIWFGLEGARMHLTRKQVKQLLPYLTKFAETGELKK